MNLIVQLENPRRMPAVENFNSLLEAQIIIADWRRDYNEYRPHSAPGMLTPTAFSAPQPQPALS